VRVKYNIPASEVDSKWQLSSP